MATSQTLPQPLDAVTVATWPHVADPRYASIEEPGRIAAMADYVSLDSFGVLCDDLDGVSSTLGGLTQVAAAVSGCSYSVVNLLDTRLQTSLAAHGAEAGVCSVEESMCAVVLHEQRPVVLSDAAADPRFDGNPFVTGPLGSIRTYVSVPLTVPSGHSLGTLCVYDDRSIELTRPQVAALERLAEQVVAVLELRRRTAAIATAHVALERSHALLSEFAGRVSHDVKSPLTAVIGFADMLADSDAVRADDSAALYLQRLRASATRMSCVVDDMLAFAAVGATPSWDRVSLEEVLAEVTDDLAVPFQASGAAIEGPPAEMLADRTQLRLLLQNLVGNAIKYRRPGEPPRIGVHLTQLFDGWSLRSPTTVWGSPLSTVTPS